MILLLYPRCGTPDTNEVGKWFIEIFMVFLGEDRWKNSFLGQNPCFSTRHKVGQILDGNQVGLLVTCYSYYMRLVAQYKKKKEQTPRYPLLQKKAPVYDF